MYTDVTDAGLVHLAGMKHLRKLDLTQTRVTTEGIAAVRPMHQEARRHDQMQRDDRNRHQRCDLSADPFQVEKAEQPHGRCPAVARASTIGENK